MSTSISIAIICGANLQILNVNANFGGSAHDSLIWRNSGVHDTLEGLYQERNARAWLIGDIKKALAIEIFCKNIKPKFEARSGIFLSLHNCWIQLL
jgi:hypothetical protein